MLQLRNQGMVLGADGEKMSKSRGNVIAPDELVQNVRRGHGARLPDVRLPLGRGRPVEHGEHRGRGALAASRLDARGRPGSDGCGRAGGCHASMQRVTHQTIEGDSRDLEAYEFNTIIAALMEMTNALYKLREQTEGSPEWNEAIETLLMLMAPVTPHIAEELWAVRGGEYSVHQQSWPVFDASARRGR